MVIFSTYDSGSGTTPPEVATSYPTDAGTAIPALNILDVLGGTGLNTAGAANVVTINLDVPVVVSNGGTGAVTLTDRGLLIGRGTSAIEATGAGTDGQVVIAATGANPAFSTITSTSGTVSFTLGANTLNLETGGAVAKSFTTNSGTATPSSGILSIVGSHGLNTSGATNVVTVAVNNTLTLGDLSAIAANSNALTATTGDVGITAGNLKIPSTTGATVGNILQNGNRFIHCYPDFRSTFVGVASGNFTQTGNSNIGIGNNALASLTNSSGSTCVGASAGQALTTGGSATVMGFGALSTSSTGGTCCAFGYNSQKVTTSASNSSFGYQTLLANVTGTALSAFGSSTLGKCTGSSNSAFGNICCRDVTSGARNSAFGDTALVNLSTGNDNLALGYFAGQQLTLTDSSNILLLSTGTTGDNNTTRIGSQGSGARQQNKCFIAGIVGVTNSNAQPVTIDSTTGQLGVGLSSLIAITEVTGTSSALVAGNSYIANNAGIVTLTLPSTGTLGDIIQIIGKGAGLFKIAQNASQQIFITASATTAGVTGSLTAVEQYACITLRCTTTNTGWTAINLTGTYTVA